MCISQIWGSIFSYRGGRVIWKWPEQIPYPVALMFGDPLPSTITAPEVRQTIQELSAETAIRDSAAQPFGASALCPGGRALPANVSALPYRYFDCQTAHSFLCEGTGRRDCHRTLVENAANWLGKECRRSGFLPSVGGALANIALPIARAKTSVNLNYTSGTESIRSAVRKRG